MSPAPPDRRRSRLAQSAVSAAAALRREVLKRIDRRRIVFRWQRPAASAPDDWGGVDLLHTTRIEDIPPTAFADSDPNGYPRDWYRGFFDDGAQLWCALEHGRALGSLWAIDRERLTGWHLPLEGPATILYGVVTPRRLRGRGIASRLALAAAREAHTRGHAVYLDCLAWNRPAHRAFAKAGFVPIAMVGSRWRGSGDDG